MFRALTDLAAFLIVFLGFAVFPFPDILTVFLTLLSLTLPHLPVCLLLFCLNIWSHQMPATASSNSLLYGMGNLTCTQSSHLELLGQIC